MTGVMANSFLICTRASNICVRVACVQNTFIVNVGNHVLEHGQRNRWLSGAHHRQ